jgi:hypothetical protein
MLIFEKVVFRSTILPAGGSLFSGLINLIQVIIRGNFPEPGAGAEDNEKSK